MAKSVGETVLTISRIIGGIPSKGLKVELEIYQGERCTGATGSGIIPWYEVKKHCFWKRWPWRPLYEIPVSVFGEQEVFPDGISAGVTMVYMLPHLSAECRSWYYIHDMSKGAAG